MPTAAKLSRLAAGLACLCFLAFGGAQTVYPSYLCKVSPQSPTETHSVPLGSHGTTYYITPDQADRFETAPSVSFLGFLLVGMLGAGLAGKLSSEKAR